MNKKQVIRLNESQLRKIVSESVRRVINEMNNDDETYDVTAPMTLGYMLYCFCDDDDLNPETLNNIQWLKKYNNLWTELYPYFRETIQFQYKYSEDKNSWIVRFTLNGKTYYFLSDTEPTDSFFI